MKRLVGIAGLSAAILLAVMSGVASAAILGQHSFTWWDDSNLGLMVTPLNAPPPTAASVPLLDLHEWHLDQADTTAWYAGAAVPGAPQQPLQRGQPNQHSELSQRYHRRRYARGGSRSVYLSHGEPGLLQWPCDLACSSVQL